MPASIRSNTTIQTDFTLPGAVLVTKRDVAASLDAYENLLRASKQFRLAMQAASRATCDFAVALENCARQKGASSSPPHRGMADSQQFTPASASASSSNPAAGADGRGSPSPSSPDEAPPSERLMAAAGLHHLLGNHQHILSDSLYRQFEVPLMDEFDGHRRAVAERQAAYEQSTMAKTKLIRETEARNMKAGRKKQRDLNSFRQALSELQAHVDDLDSLKVEHYSEVLENEQEMWDSIANKTALVVKSEIDVFDRIVTKGSVDPVLESMQHLNPDPFGAYEQHEDPATIFSVLPTTSIISTAASASRQSFARHNSYASTSSVQPSSPTTPLVSASTAQAEHQRTPTKREQWTRPLSAISESSRANGSSEHGGGGTEGSEAAAEHVDSDAGDDAKAPSEAGSQRTRTGKTSDGPPVEGGSSMWAS